MTAKEFLKQYLDDLLMLVSRREGENGCQKT
jgi:hypothetical protein